jgi:required for meiotic nuclear division protein 1
MPAFFRALLLGERLDTRRLECAGTLATTPTTLQLADGGVAVLFRHVVAVLFNASQSVENEFLNRLGPHLVSRFVPPHTDEVGAEVNPAIAIEDTIDPSGAIVLQDGSIGWLQTVAIVLARKPGIISL